MLTTAAAAPLDLGQPGVLLRGALLILFDLRPGLGLFKSRPTMRFVAVKTVDQQAVLMLHKVRDLLVRQRTMAINALRGHLAEFGIVAAQGPAGVKTAIAEFHTVVLTMALIARGR